MMKEEINNLRFILPGEKVHIEDAKLNTHAFVEE
jgi:hypothetical protein